MIEIPSSFVEQYIMQYVGYPKSTGGKVTGGCPYCHEDKSWGKKSRFFYYPATTSCHCFNCGITRSGYMFIKDHTGMGFREIAKLVREDTGEGILVGDTIYDGSSKSDEPKRIIPDLPPNCLDLLDESQHDYFGDDFYTNLALGEIERRRLATAVNRPRSLYFTKEDFIHKNRIIIPFYNIQRDVAFYQSRALTKKQSDEFGKYISKLDGDKSVCGIDRIDPALPYLFMFEGPLDSFFVRNGLALTGLKATASQQRELEPLRAFYDIVWCLDNHFDNDDTRGAYEDLIASGERVFLWDGETSEKDLNEKCVEEERDGVDPQWILDNAHEGRAASRIMAKRARGR